MSLTELVVVQLLTGYGQLMLAEFKYGGVPKETFAEYLGDQKKPAALYYYLKKDLFPWAYWNHMVCAPVVWYVQGPERSCVRCSSRAGGTAPMASSGRSSLQLQTPPSR